MKNLFLKGQQLKFFLQNFRIGVPTVVRWVHDPVYLCGGTGLIQYCYSCGIGCGCSLDSIHMLPMWLKKKKKKKDFGLEIYACLRRVIPIFFFNSFIVTAVEVKIHQHKDTLHLCKHTHHLGEKEQKLLYSPCCITEVKDT